MVQLFELTDDGMGTKMIEQFMTTYLVKIAWDASPPDREPSVFSPIPHGLSFLEIPLGGHALVKVRFRTVLFDSSRL